MQIVIKISEDVFTRLFDNGTEDYAIANDDLFAVAKSIRNGTPLPKGHGRLIDADELLNHVEDYGENQLKLMLIDPYYVKHADTIIEGSESE